MIKLSLAKKILNILLKNGGDFSEIFIQKRIANSLSLEDRKLENASSGFELGCGLRIISGDRKDLKCGKNTWFCSKFFL